MLATAVKGITIIALACALVVGLVILAVLITQPTQATTRDVNNTGSISPEYKTVNVGYRSFYVFEAEGWECIASNQKDGPLFCK